MKKSATKVLVRTGYPLLCLAGRDSFAVPRPQGHRFDGSRALHPVCRRTVQLELAPLACDPCNNHLGSRP
jgi:hypothetical protein